MFRRFNVCPKERLRLLLQMDRGSVVTIVRRPTLS